MTCAYASDTYWLPSFSLVSTGIVWTGRRNCAARRKRNLKQGADLAPGPLHMTGSQPRARPPGQLHGQRAGRVNDCHTVPSYARRGNPFAGRAEEINAPCYLAGGGEFGPLCRATSRRAPTGSRPIAPSSSSRTDAPGDDFRDPRHAYPAGDALARLRRDLDRELEAIYEFLRAIPTTIRGRISANLHPCRSPRSLLEQRHDAPRCPRRRRFGDFHS